VNLRLYAGIAAGIALFALGWLTSSWRHDSVQLAIGEAVSATQAATNLSTARAIAAIEVTNKTIYQNVIERTRTELVYQECKHSPEAFALVIEAFK